MAAKNSHYTRGKLADPDFRSERARKAALASHSINRHVREIVDRAPELTQEQRDKLAVLLRGDAA